MNATVQLQSAVKTIGEYNKSLDEGEGKILLDKVNDCGAKLLGMCSVLLETPLFTLFAHYRGC